MTRGAERPGGEPLSRWVRVDDLPDDGLEERIEASPEECSAVAAELDLPSVAGLAARYRLIRAERGRVQVAGDLSATITQICVVTLEPFESELVQPIEATFAPVPRVMLPSDRMSRRRGSPEPAQSAPAASTTPADPDTPDPIVDGRIDLGSLAVEFLALGLDFYPRKPGVHFNDVVIGDTDAPKPSAFAALGRLKDGS